MIRKTIVSCAVACAAATSAHAESIEVSTTVGFESRYIFRGVQFAETSFQPAINLSYGNFYGGIWANLPVGDDDFVVTPGGEELDLFAGYGFDLNEFIALDVGVTFYTFPNAASGFLDLFSEGAAEAMNPDPGTNTVEAYAGASFNAPLSPSLYVYRDFHFNTVTLQGDVSHSIPLAEKTSFDLSGSLGYVIDDDDGLDYLYGAASADVAYAISDHGSIAAGVRYGGSDIDGGAFIDDSIAGTTQSSGLWWGVSFSADF